MARISTGNLHTKTLVDRYETPDHTVFGVYRGGRHWERFAEAGWDPYWIEHKSNGRDAEVPEEDERWLEGIRQQRKHLAVVRRFPRRKENVQTEFTDSSWERLPQFDPSRSYKTKWLIRSFLAERSLQLVFGERGSFKSTLYLFCARAVSRGEKFLGMKTRQRRVLYLDYENPASVIRARWEDLKLGLPNSWLIIWDRFTRGFIPKPGDELLRDLVKSSVEQTGRGPWIIFDSWSSLLKSGEGGENTGQVAPVYAELRKLVDLGATITVMDHTKKYDSGTLYGSQDKEAKVDTIHSLKLFDAETHNPIVTVESWLKRFAPRHECKFSFQVDTSRDRKGGWHIASLELVEDPQEANLRRKRESIKALIRRNPDYGQDELGNEAMAQRIDSRDKVIEMLKAGVGKYWTVRRVARGKYRYEVIQH